VRRSPAGDAGPPQKTDDERGAPAYREASNAGRLTATAVALLVFAVAGAYAWNALRPPPGAKPVPGPPESFLEDLPGGWTELAPPPEVRCCAASVWTGSELVVWGGYDYTGFSDEFAQATGFRYDPASNTWSPIAPSPIEARSNPAFAWTGEELLVWGGWHAGGPPFFGDGAAYDPRTDRWRMLPPAPIDPRVPLSAWTGREFILWGTGVRVDQRPRDGAAYDPSTDTWRSIADGPIELTDATATWTGREMIVFGAALRGGNFPETETAIAAAYDPAADSWRRLANSTMNPNANTATWNGEELIA
jgi:N-acetylneuraminic acid mutarotase